MSYSGQTTTSTSKPLKWAITHSGSDKNDLLTTTTQLKLALGSFVSEYGGNFSLLSKVIQCESGWKTDVYSKGKISYGISQFTYDTWKENCKGDYKNPYDQLRCMTQMFSKGMAGRWDCFRMLK